MIIRLTLDRPWSVLRCVYEPLAGLGVAAVFAASAAAQQAPPHVSDDSLHIDGVFNSDLPRTEHKFNLKLVVHPHFGDFTQRDYLRVPVRLIYGVTGRWEISEETDTYFAHGLRKKPFFSQEGLSGVGVATKYDIGNHLWPGWDIGVGAGYIMPVSNPPAEVTDGLKHLNSFVTFAHQLERHPNLRVFWGVGSDLVRQTSIPFERTKNELRDNAQNLTVGGVWAHGAVTYTLETSYSTTRLTGHTARDLYQVRPGFILELPKKWTFHSKGQWLFGLSVNAEHGPDGNSVGASGKLRINFDFKNWWRSKKPPPSPAP
ncbi:MAG TPA: hypothetical protein VLT83_02295 [Opitutaceae bacterium]|nr:hypothetical protein [Opitutaceae bacterium]